MHAAQRVWPALYEVVTCSHAVNYVQAMIINSHETEEAIGVVSCARRPVGHGRGRA